MTEIKPNDKAIDAARAESKRWQEGLNRRENQIPCWKVLREADDGYDGYDVIAKFNSREERDEALERFRAEAMVTAAYAAQFQSGDYAGLVERLRNWGAMNYKECDEAADALEALLAEREAWKAESKKLREALIDTTASLVASVSLLERGGKKAAPSDKMFAQMLVDYKNSIDRARAAIEGVTEPQQSGAGNE